MHWNSNAQSKRSHKKICFVYVQLLRLQTLDEIQISQNIILDNIKNKPDPKL